MPAKKNKKTKNEKKHSKKQSVSSIKKDIAKAVEGIPSLVSEQLHMSDNKQKEKQTVLSSSKTESKSKTHAHHFTYEHHHVISKKKLLWFGVACLTLIIVAMWIWNVRVFLYEIKEQQKNNPEEGLLYNVKDDFQNVLDSLERKKTDRDATLSQVDKQIKTAIDGQKLEKGVQEIITKSITDSKEE